ncbi:MAG: M56 family metallopeptidase [Pedobacter sp.]|uniref:M56 family metallopeptidase n=1 Tax=Pedobacter sp. TaxID=1411316 RepID=UPI003564FD0D
MEPILNNLIKAVGWSILHSLWQGAIIYGLLLLIAMTVPKLKSRIKHNLAFGAIALIFICFCLTFFSIFKLPTSTTHQHSTTFFIPAEYYQSITSLPQLISSKTELFFPYIVGVYSMGLLCQLLVLGIGYKRMLDLKKAVHFSVPAEWDASFKRLILQLKFRQPIGFYLSDKINVPLVVGYFKPIILFPIGLISQLDMDQVEAILIHELSHIKRNDYLLNLIKTGIETLLFFNPFIWLSGKFINIEREHACDDLVLKFTGNPMTYAHALLKLELLKDKSAPAFSMAASGKNQHLYQRIKRITDMKNNYMNVRQQMFVITLTIATIISLAWIKPLKAEKTITKISKQTRTEIAGFSIQQTQTPPKAPPVPKSSTGHNITAICIPQPPTPPNAPHAPEVSIPVPPVPPHHIGQDTTRKKSKYRIITIDEQGNRKEYKSVKEIPQKERSQMLNDTYKIDLDNEININVDSILNKSLAFLKSPEWKKSMAEIGNSAENIGSYFSSADWKKQQAEINKNAENISKYFNSKEWKKQQENIRRNAEKIEKNAEKIEKHINSKEFQLKIEEAKKAIKEKEAQDHKP